MNERNYMRLALDLAKRGEGYVSPNPLVGAVIVKNGRIIGRGWHERYGGKHAEQNAIDSLSESAEGADMYVTLEPCCHHGHQPPCTAAIIRAGIKRVIVASDDPNPQVAGKGIEILRSNGIEVVEGVMKEESVSLNEVFFHYITTRTPFVALKYAMTLDGKIACHTGESRWITGEEARKHVHTLRNRYSAILTGIGTVISDDPLLTCRLSCGRNPIRVIADTTLRTPLASAVVKTASTVKTIIATSVTDRNKINHYEDAGCIVLSLPFENGHLSIPSLIQWLGDNGVDSVLCECGGRLSWSLLESNLVNKVYAYIAPKIFGGEISPTPVEGNGVADPLSAVQLKNIAVRCFDDDFLVEGDVMRCLQG